MNTTIDRSACTGTKHGTYVDYQHHHCRCPDARETARIYRKRLREGRNQPGLVPSTGTRRRVEALLAIGWTKPLICQATGLSGRALTDGLHRSLALRRTDTAIRRVYDAWSMTPGPSDHNRERGRRWGYAPPLAWDEATIDNPAARPRRTGPADYGIDWSAVWRVLDRLPLTSRPNQATRRAIIAHGIRAGIRQSELADILGVTVDAINQQVARTNRAQRAGGEDTAA